MLFCVLLVTNPIVVCFCSSIFTSVNLFVSIPHGFPSLNCDLTCTRLYFFLHCLENQNETVAENENETVFLFVLINQQHDDLHRHSVPWNCDEFSGGRI